MQFFALKHSLRQPWKLKKQLGLMLLIIDATRVIRFLAGLFDKGVLFEVDNCCSTFSSTSDFILSKLDCRVVVFSYDSVCF
ncbi:hypothetical protein VIGAN_05247800, partial [Vigna angularis var. angularis]